MQITSVNEHTEDCLADFPVPLNEKAPANSSGAGESL